MSTRFQMDVSDAELLEKNHIYDKAADAIWDMTVYEPVHDGWNFTNMGGRAVLDFIGQAAELNSNKEAVEFCSGLGDTCRYLASKFDCHVTGIEMNSNQIEQARAKAAQVGPALSGRMSFVQSNILDWKPEKPFDLVYSLDSLVLIKEIEKVLGKARDILKPSGMIALAEMTAGPSITDKHRQFAWEVDGMVSLLSPEEFAMMLDELGFTSIEMEDMTDLAEDCFNKIHAACRERKDAIISAAGEGPHQSWMQLSDIYRRFFRERRFCYTRLIASRR